MESRIRGYSYALAAAFLVAISPITIKIILGRNSPVVASLYWMASSLIASTALMLIMGKMKAAFHALRSSWRILLLIGFLNGIGIIGWFFSIDLIGASVSSFLGRIGTIVLVTLSVIFLKERFNIFEGFGMALALAGVYIITFSPMDFIGWKIVYITVGSSAYSIAQLISKDYMKGNDPLILTYTSTIIISIMIFLYAAVGDAGLSIHLDGIGQLLILLLVPLLSEVIAPALMYLSYKHIDVGKAQVVRSCFPFIVIIYAFVLSRTLPLMHQIIGGSLIVIGVVILIGFRRLNKGIRRLVKARGL